MRHKKGREQRATVKHKQKRPEHVTGDGLHHRHKSECLPETRETRISNYNYYILCRFQLNSKRNILATEKQGCKQKRKHGYLAPGVS